MKLRPDHKELLEKLYVKEQTALDQLKRTPGVLSRIAKSFCEGTGRDDDPETLHRYMVNRRKNQDWPRLGDKARHFPPAASELTAKQLAVLESIYVKLDVTSDEYLFRPKFVHNLEREFSNRAGLRIPGNTLVAVIIQKRKRGEWVTIREEVEKENKAAAKAFNDIPEVLKKYGKRTEAKPTNQGGLAHVWWALLGDSIMAVQGASDAAQKIHARVQGLGGQAGQRTRLQHTGGGQESGRGPCECAGLGGEVLFDVG